jgi:hypothetical protein
MASMSCCLSAWLASFWSNRLLLSLSTSSTLGPMMLVGLHAAEKQVGREQPWLWVRSVCTVLACTQCRVSTSPEAQGGAWQPQPLAA